MALLAWSTARGRGSLTPRVKRTVLLHGLIGGVLITLLKVVEYRYLVLEHSLEIYGGIVAVLFASLGIWLGRRLTRERVVTREVRVDVPVEVPVHVPVEVRVAVPFEVRVEVPVEVPVARSEPFVRDQARVEQLGLTPRELDILEVMAAGLSNREIAQRLFVSENTVKTHLARLFSKLSARRRTEAVRLAKAARLIP